MTKVDDLIAWGQLEIGKPYVYGAEGPNSFDCSGLMQFVFGKVGISLPRTAHEQQAATRRVSSPAPGDLVFFGQPAYHVGLYIGGGKMISAPSPGQRVHIVGVGSPTNYGRVAGLGTALAPVVATVAAGTATVTGLTSSLLGPVRNVAVEGLFVMLGVGLVGYGLYRTVVAPTIAKQASQVEGLL